jgi:hypothetical protein
MVYVASNVDPSRRHERLSWSHHAEVAAVAPDQQDRWLNKAEEDRLSVQDLRLLLRNERKRDSASEMEEPTRIDHATVCPECGHTFAAAAAELRAQLQHRKAS